MRALLLMAALGATLACTWPTYAVGEDGKPQALLLDHDMLTSMARTKEPELRIGYTAERVEFRTRRSALVGWVDVLLTARFERAGSHVQLVAQSLRAGPLVQTGKRFDEAKAGLLRLVNVETPADRVEIYRAGKLVYSQVLEQPGGF